MFGRRPDGKRLKHLDPIVQITPYLMPMRCDAQVFLQHNLDYEKMFDKIFDKYTASHELIKSKTTNMGSLYELVYEVEMKSDASGRDFIDDIRTKNGNLKVILSTPIVEESV